MKTGNLEMSHTGALTCLNNLWREMKDTLRFVIGVGLSIVLWDTTGPAMA